MPGIVPVINWFPRSLGETTSYQLPTNKLWRNWQKVASMQAGRQVTGCCWVWGKTQGSMRTQEKATRGACTRGIERLGEGVRDVRKAQQGSERLHVWLVQCKYKETGGVCMVGRELPQYLANFLNFPSDLLGKLARKVASGNYVIAGHWNWSLSASPQIAITLLYCRGCWDGWNSENWSQQPFIQCQCNYGCWMKAYMSRTTCSL